MERVQRLVSPILGVEFNLKIRNNKYLMVLNYIVYITINLCNGKFYIGVHRTNPDVFDGYIGCSIDCTSAANGEYAFHRAVRKYGIHNFKRTTLRVFPDTEEGKKQAFKLEKELVTETVIKSKQCYNMAVGGLGGNNIDNYKKVYMFDLKGEYLRSFSCVRDAALFLNQENLYSTMKAIRNNCVGTTSSSFDYYWSYFKHFGYTNNKVKKVAQYTISGKFLRYYDSIAEAEQIIGTSSIKQYLKKGTCCGFQWRYYNGDNSDICQYINFKTRNTSIPIIMCDLEGNIIEEYDCVRSCVEQHPELKSSQINRALKGIVKTHHGYTFKYKDKDIV